MEQNRLLQASVAASHSFASPGAIVTITLPPFGDTGSSSLPISSAFRQHQKERPHPGL
jgi:hypothetical protein